MNQLMRIVTNLFMNKAMNAGARRIATKGKRPEDMTREEREAARQSMQNAQNARRGINILRRFGRF